MCEYLGEDNLDDENLMKAVYSALSIYLNYQNDAAKVNDWTAGVNGSDTYGVQVKLDDYVTIFKFPTLRDIGNLFLAMHRHRVADMVGW